MMASMQLGELMDMAVGYWKSATLAAAVRLNLFGALADGKNEAGEIALQIDCSVEHLSALLDALTGMNVLVKNGQRYELASSLAAHLNPHHPDNLIDALRFNIDMYSLWGELATCIHDGKPVLPQNAHLGKNPGMTCRFVRGMHSRAQALAPAVLAAVNLEERKHLLDIGAGPGTFSSLLAEKYPALHVTLFDLPLILDVAREIHAESSASFRLHFHPADYHQDPLPEGFDAVLFCGSLHQETQHDAKRLFKNIFEQLTPGGDLIIIDLMLERQRTEPLFSALFQVNMMLARPQSHVYTSDEVIDLATSVGFEDTECDVVDRTPYWIVRARKNCSEPFEPSTHKTQSGSHPISKEVNPDPMQQRGFP